MDRICKACRQDTGYANPSTALHRAALTGHAECLESALRAGAHVNKIFSNGNRAVILAASNGHIKCVEG